MHEEITECGKVTPNEANGFSLFDPELEADDGVFFHATLARNFNAIVAHGFRSAESLGHDGLPSVTYAKRSFSCLAHLNNEVSEEYVVFAVRFESVSEKAFEETSSDIKVFLDSIQPKIICFRKLRPGFKIL